MLTSALDLETPLSVESAPVVGGLSIDRTAFYIESHGAPIFAWLHKPDYDNARILDHGVIICPPIGHEQLHAHRALRHLADRLARARIPTLRIDWHGTGDSPGNDEDPQRYMTWLTNVSDAAHWMRQQLGCRRVSLVGLRMGATLAALAMRTDPTRHEQIDNLVLWSPVVKGRSYVREMRAIGLTSEAPVRATTVPSNDIESGGFTLSAETAAELGSIDLLQSVPVCRRLLVVTRADLLEDDRLSQQYAGAGLHVQQIACPGYSQMMAEPHRSTVPATAIEQITLWLAEAIATDTGDLKQYDVTSQSTSVALTVSRRERLAYSEPVDVAREPAVAESTLRICSQPDLFGIVSEPVTDACGSLPTIVLLNSGSAYRIGASRLNVLLARHLAAQGFRCVRMDLSGLGDSVSESPERENDSYAPTMFRDIDLALKEMARRYGPTQFVLMGLCSGAYAAFQSAVQIPNPALVESVLINPLTYFWTEGMTLETSATKHLMEFHHSMSSAIDPRKWWKLLTGQSKLGIGGALKLVGRRMGIVKQRPVAASPRKVKTRLTGITHPVKDDLPGDLKRIKLVNRQLAMFFSCSDPGFGILNCKAKRRANELRAAGRLNIAFIDEADHTFTSRAARSDLIHAIADHLRKRYR